jgi:hypothetical protein
MTNADGTGLVQVTDYGLNANHSVWSANGRHLPFSAHNPKTNTDGIAIIDLPWRSRGISATCERDDWIRAC